MHKVEADAGAKPCPSLGFQILKCKLHDNLLQFHSLKLHPRPMESLMSPRTLHTFHEEKNRPSLQLTPSISPTIAEIGSFKNLRQPGTTAASTSEKPQSPDPLSTHKNANRATYYIPPPAWTKPQCLALHQTKSPETAES